MQAQKPRQGGALGAPAPMSVRIWSNEPTPRLLCGDEDTRCLLLLPQQEAFAGGPEQLPSTAWACMPDMDGTNDAI